MKQFGKDLLSTNLGVPSHKLLLWNVYTDTDFEFQNKKNRHKCTKLIPIYYNHTIYYMIPIICPNTFTNIYMYSLFYFRSISEVHQHSEKQ